MLNLKTKLSEDAEFHNLIQHLLLQGPSRQTGCFEFALMDKIGKLNFFEGSIEILRFRQIGKLAKFFLGTKILLLFFFF